MLGLGILISVSSRSAVQAQGVAVFAWFGFVLLYDLVLMGALGAGGMPVEMLSVALVINPVDAARVLAVLALEPDLYLLGPAGAFLTSKLSQLGTALLLLASLATWAVVPLVISSIRFSLPRTVWRRPTPVPRSPALSSQPAASSTRGFRLQPEGNRR